MSENHVTRKQLLIVAFVSGAAIMTIEIAAARLLAPYFGTSLLIWTNIIGVVLLALSAGYFFGGRIADRRPHVRLLFTLLVAAGAAGIAIPWVVRPIARFVTLDALLLQSGSFFIFIASFAVTLLLLAVPLCLLGMISPFIIKLYSIDQHRVGESSGTVFAVSTVGSIIGTFLPALFLIPTFGTNATITSAGVALLAVGCWGTLHSTATRTAALLLTLIASSFAGSAGIRATSATLYEGESLYHYIRVEQGTDGSRRLIFNEGLGFQSEFHPDRILTGNYFDYYSTLPIFFNSGRKLNVLILGLAGGTISRQLSHFYGDRLHIDGVEIDKKVIDIGYRFFDLGQKNLSVFNEDGTVYLMRSVKKYDIVIVDAYHEELYIPWTMTTQEFWRLVSEKLSPDGIVAMNVIGSPDMKLVRAIANTQASVFQSVFTAGAGENNLNTTVVSGNRVFFSDDLKYDTAPEELWPLIRYLTSTAESVLPDPGGPVLTNDKAPVEFMTDSLMLGQDGA